MMWAAPSQGILPAHHRQPILDNFFGVGSMNIMLIFIGHAGYEFLAINRDNKLTFFWRQACAGGQ